MLKIWLHFVIFAMIVFQATMLQSWQSEKHELVPEHVETRPTDGVKPGPRPAESSLSIAQAAIDWINSGKWHKEDGTVQLPDGHTTSAFEIFSNASIPTLLWIPPSAWKQLGRALKLLESFQAPQSIAKLAIPSTLTTSVVRLCWAISVGSSP